MFEKEIKKFEREVRTISWTKRNKEKKNMAYTEQEKERALALYDELGSIGKVINQLGYPTRQNMYTWIKNRNISFSSKELLLTTVIRPHIEDILLWK